MIGISTSRSVCGNDCEIAIDAHYWNYKVDPEKIDQSWGSKDVADFILYKGKKILAS